MTGFEPATSWSQTRRSTKLSYTPSDPRDLTRSRPRRIQNLGVGHHHWCVPQVILSPNCPHVQDA